MALKIQSPKVVPPTLYEACKRVAAVVHTWVVPESQPVVVLSTEGALNRSDLVALLAAVGWQVTVEQAADEAPMQEDALFEATP